MIALNVTRTKVKIMNDYIINRGEYKINTCEFEFSEEYNGLVKKAVFETNVTRKEIPIINNICNIPYEVLFSKTIELKVFAYTVENNELVLRYSPGPVTLATREGSFDGETGGGEVITPTQFELYEQALNDGLTEVANVDINAEQLEDGASVTITDRTGAEKTVTIHDGAKGDKGNDGYTPIKGVDYYTQEDIASLNIPTKTSQLQNDSGFITKYVNDLTNYTDTINMNTAISGAVGTETTNRQNADLNLQNQIDAIVSASDVVDVVSTYADLQNYDTTKLTSNDVVKVMQDSTHNNAISYYRWTISSNVGAWSYIGSEGPFYTKGETDNLLNGKYTKPVNGIPSTDMTSEVQTSLGKADTALQQHQDISGKEDKSNKVTSLSAQSTDTQYPSAKAVYDIIGNIETILTNLNTEAEAI